MNKKFILFFGFITLEIVNADISHLFHSGHGYFQPQTHLNNAFVYGPSSTVSTSTEFFFPEVIDNRQIKNSLTYYIPPGEQQPPPKSTESPSQAYIPIQSYQNGGDSNFVVVYDQNRKGGYEYNEPSTPAPLTTQEPPLIIPPALLPPVGDFPSPPIEAPPEEEGYEYHPPQQPPITYLPSNTVRSSKDIFDQFSVSSKTTLRVKVHEMRCLSNQGGYFRAQLKIDGNLGVAPIVERDLVDSQCSLNLALSVVSVDISSEDFDQCGVYNCGQHLCLRLRFPSIRGMKTGTDALLTLQCKKQTRIVAKTHAIKMGISNEVQGRSLGAYAQGGSQQPFRTHVELLKKSGNGFTKLLEQNGMVQLGEELLLRAHVIVGDGWNYTKLTDVNLQRQTSGDLLNSVNLIASNGCINPSMQAICPYAPVFDPPLGYRLLFKAVMFEGMKSGDEIVMTLKISGCLEHHDCHINSQNCNDVSFGSRPKRGVDKYKNQTVNEFSEISQIAFRVELPSENLKTAHENTMWRSQLAVGSAAGFVGLLVLIGMFAFWKLRN